MRNNKVFHYLIIVMIIAVNFAIFMGVSEVIVDDYREVNNRKNMAIIGAVLESHSSQSAKEEIVTDLLQDKYKYTLMECPSQGAYGDEMVCAYYRNGAAILQKYGYLEDDYVDASTQNFTEETSILLILILVGDAILLMAIRVIERSKIQRNLLELQQYLQRMANADYDLALESNSENSFSLLRNELYKIAVTLREAADQNRKATENLETALEDISHQLRTPLTALQITLDNLRDGKNLSEKSRQEMLTSARRQVASMTELVVTLLNLAKFDNKTIKLNPEPTKVGDIVKQAVDKISILAELSDVGIVIKGDKTATIECDAAWQTEAVMNIIKNCVEFSPPGKQVEVKIEDSLLFAKITIQDYGPGISKTDQKRIFRRFYQASGASSDHVGIGLNFAKTIIENEFGRVTVDSEIGNGAKFTITYPKK